MTPVHLLMFVAIKWLLSDFLEALRCQMFATAAPVCGFFYVWSTEVLLLVVSIVWRTNLRQSHNDKLKPSHYQIHTNYLNVKFFIEHYNRISPDPFKTYINPFHWLYCCDISINMHMGGCELLPSNGCCKWDDWNLGEKRTENLRMEEESGCSENPLSLFRVSLEEDNFIVTSVFRPEAFCHHSQLRMNLCTFCFHIEQKVKTV